MFSASWWDSKFCFRSEPIYGPKEHSYSEPFWVVKDIGNQFVSAHFGKQKKKQKFLFSNKWEVKQALRIC
jgi:hypothetical protein